MQSWTIKEKSCCAPSVLWESAAFPLLIWTTLVINGHSQAGSHWRTAQNPPVTLAPWIFPISRDQSSEKEVLGAAHFSIQESRKKIHECVLTGCLVWDVYGATPDWLISCCWTLSQFLSYHMFVYNNSQVCDNFLLVLILCKNHKASWVEGN